LRAFGFSGMRLVKGKTCGVLAASERLAREKRCLRRMAALCMGQARSERFVSGVRRVLHNGVGVSRS